MSENRPQDSDKHARLLEDIYIILCILTLWPVVLRWHHPVFQYVMYVALVGLGIVFFRRVKRFADARRNLRR